MATTTNSTDQNSRSVDASLWWDPFSLLLTDLENVSLSSSDELPPSLVKKFKDNHVWFLGTVSLFKPPNQKSREALDSHQVKIGSHQLIVEPELKDTALKISSVLCLDEVQSYILVKRSMECSTLLVDNIVHELLHLVMLQYYIERQCLLKCTRQILMHALYDGTVSKGHAMRGEAQKLISDGLESRLLSVLQDLLSSTYPEHMNVDLFTLWAEETLMEDNLILDIFFLAYYESFCSCDAKQWKKLCLIYEGIISGSYNFGKLAISAEAIYFIYHAKVQLLLILIKTLDLESLLQMVHDEIPFRQGSTAFSLIDVQDMDALVSRFNVVETNEAGPLILAWAVFLCLISSLPEKEENSVLMEIDHVSYVGQAFEVASMSYFLEILRSHVLKDSDGPIVGYRSVLRTFLSAFIASYEINLQLEDNSLQLILDILSEIYQGEESLCIQFWDRDSFIDGPIRCLLFNLEGEFPFRTVGLLRLLSALCEGIWPSECVYNFLDKFVGLSSLFEISMHSAVNDTLQIVEVRQPLPVPGVEGLIIPSNTRGYVLKVINGDTALVRWEYTLSGVRVLLLRLGQELYMDSNEETLVILDLLSRLVTFNMGVCCALMDIGNPLNEEAEPMNRHIEKINLVEIICTLVKNLSTNCHGAVMMSMGVNILAKMLKCSPSFVTAIALKANIFDDASSRTNPFDLVSNGLSKGSWLLSGRLAKMLLIDCEQNDSRCPLTLSVLDFIMQLVETGAQNDVVLALVIFSLQYIFVNHEYWKFKVKHARWKVTLKVLEVIKKCILSIPYRQKLCEVVRDISLCDSSIHNALFRIVCITTQDLEKLYVSRLFDLMEIEGLQLAISFVLDILFIMLSDLSKDVLPRLTVLHQAMLSSTTKPIPVRTAVISLISCFRNPTIQMGAVRLLSKLFVFAEDSQSYVSTNACFGLDDKQIADFRNSVNSILCDQSPANEDLIVASFELLTSAARCQPAFLAAIVASKENLDGQLSNANGVKNPGGGTIGFLGSKEVNLLDTILHYVGIAEDLIKRKPNILLNVLNFLKALWQEAAQFTNILEWLKKSEKLWRQLSNSILVITSMHDEPFENLTEMEALSSAYRYQCQAVILQVMAHDIFLQKKLLQAKLLVKQTSESSRDGKEKKDSSEKAKDGSLLGLTDIVSTWHKSWVLGNLIESYVSCTYDHCMYRHVKIAVALFSVHVMEKLKSGDSGSLSVSLIEKIHILSQKLSNLPAFAELLSQYTERGYREGKELQSLILSDLYYHLQGELEGRNIDHKPFKELSQFLLESNFLQTYLQKYDGDLVAHTKDVHLFDAIRIRADLGLDKWDFSEWRASKAVAETLLLRIQDMNSMVLLANSKLSALKSLKAILSIHDEDSTEKKATTDGKIPGQLILSSIDHICQCLHTTTESLAPIPDGSEDILDFLAAQADLLLHLIISIHKKLSLPACLHILKTSGYGLKVLSGFSPSIGGVRTTIKLLLLLLLSSVEWISLNSASSVVTEMESVEALAEASNASLGLLPILCNCIDPTGHCTLSLTTIDLILKGFSTPATWYPIMQKHLQLQYIIQKLQDQNSYALVPVILKFLLTLARVRGGAEMILNAGFFASLRVLFDGLSDDRSFSVIQSERRLPNSSDKIEKPQHIWGLGLAVVTAMIHSLGDSSSATGPVDYVMTYLFLEKFDMICYYLNAPDVPFDDHDEKRARAKKTQTSLSALKETEHTLLLICVLAKHRNSWVKVMKEKDSLLRERIIHLLAFISRGTQRLGESRSRVALLLCHPIMKEEFEIYKKPSFINSKNGWFALSPLGCGLDRKFSALSSKSTAIVIKDQMTDNTEPAPQTYFSDITAIQIYRIAFLLLKFLCVQVEDAARRAEEVGFVDLAHFPELPMPDILHGLQDQGIAVATELCEAHKLKLVPTEIQGVCILLLQITLMALYLEFCVSQICGIRPVLGHVEDFSKELKLFIRATEGNTFMKESVKSLKRIISLLYPELVQTERSL